MLKPSDWTLCGLVLSLYTIAGGAIWRVWTEGGTCEKVILTALILAFVFGVTTKSLMEMGK